MKKRILDILPYIVIIVVVILIRTYIITPVTVSGNSMVPTLHNKELLLLSKISYKIHDIDRFDIVVIKEEDWIIKRIIGLPGESIIYKDNRLYINGKEVIDNYGIGNTSNFNLNKICNINRKNNSNFECPTNKIPEDYYLVLGDNRMISKDSRSIGLVPKNMIKGKAIFRFFPLTKIKIL